MPYTPTLDDIEEIEGKQAKSGGYSPSLADIDEFEKQSVQPKSLHDVVFQGLRPQSIKDIPGELSNIGRAGLAGLLKGGQGIGEFEAKGVRPVANYLGIPVAQSMQQSLGNSDVTGINKLYSPKVAASPEGQIAYALGQSAPYATMPLGEGGMLAKALKAGATTEALAPAFNPDVSISEAYKQGLAPAGIAAGISGAFGVPKALGSLLKMGGKATPEQFAANLRAAGNKPIGIGKLSKSPMVAGTEDNFLTNLPFSGMSQKDIEVGNIIKNDIDDVLNELDVIPESKEPEHIPGQPPQPKETKIQKIAKNYKKNVEDEQKIKTKNYEERNDISRQIGEEQLNQSGYEKVKDPSDNEEYFVKPSSKILDDNDKLIGIKFPYNAENKTHKASDVIAHINTDQTAMYAKKELENINSDINRYGYTTVPQEVIKDLEAAAKITPIPVDKVNFKRGEYGEKYAQAGSAQKANEERIYRNLHHSINQDMQNGINSINDPRLSAAQKKADLHYQQKIVPVLDDPKMYQHWKGTANQDSFLQDFIKEGKYDKPQQIYAILQHLDEPHRKQFAHEFLTRGLREIDGTESVVRGDAVLSLWKKLGPESKRLMFSPKQIEKLDRALNARELMGASLDQMSNPKTGYTHAKAMVTGGAGTLAAALGHTLAMHGINPAVAYSAATGGIGGLGRLLTNYLTSPASRKVYQKGLNLSAMNPKAPVSPTAIANLLAQANQNGGQ